MTTRAVAARAVAARADADGKADVSPSKEAIQHMRQAIAGGRHWFEALLESMALWTTPEETWRGRRYQYLIADEAFDWFALAERLCAEADGLVPKDERDGLLVQGLSPVLMTRDQFRRLLGPVKFRAYLNYWYGVVVEDALVAAVEEEVRKDRRSRGYARPSDAFVRKQTSERVYGQKEEELFQMFLTSRPGPKLKLVRLTLLREFAYWRSKYRLDSSDKARLASDTRKGLDFLKRAWLARRESPPPWVLLS